MRARDGARAIVTLTSDIGAVYTAQMKAVLLSRAPEAHVIDLADDLPAHGVGEAAFLLRAMAERFPAGTIHVVVVDPGVGGVRAPVIVRLRDGSRLVGPDNGVLWPLAERIGIDRTWRIEPARLGLRRVGTTFDGRDLFAPAAAALAVGNDPSTLGVPHLLHRRRVSRARPNASGWAIEVLHADRFGNLITNLDSEALSPSTRSFRLHWAGRGPVDLARSTSYERLGAGRLGLVDSSFGLVEIAVGLGSAAQRLGVGSGARGTLSAVGGRRSSRRPRGGTSMPPRRGARSRGSARSDGSRAHRDR
ncbi:MAG: SAM hydrolase/SAM-dependent halogenase family protein [Thermoplasmata archaeon]